MKKIIIWMFLMTVPALAGPLDDRLAACFDSVAAVTTGASLNWATLIDECQQATRDRSLACIAGGQSQEDCGSQNVVMAHKAIGKALLVRGLSER